MTLKIGDKVQWTVNGVDQFIKPKKIRMISPCGEWCFVEGNNTGLPKHQLTVILDEFSYEPFSVWSSKIKDYFRVKS